MTVEEFIGRLIRHIPDEQFKTIRYYGVYSRKKKAECKEKVAIFQETVRHIVKVKKVLKKRNWRQRIKEQTGKDPMVCSKCSCYYEFKGSVCLQNGVLKTKYAKYKYSRAYLERMITHFIQATEKREEKEETYEYQPVQETERQLCMFSVS